MAARGTFLMVTCRFAAAAARTVNEEWTQHTYFRFCGVLNGRVQIFHKRWLLARCIYGSLRRGYANMVVQRQPSSSLVICVVGWLDHTLNKRILAC